MKYLMVLLVLITFGFAWAQRSDYIMQDDYFAYAITVFAQAYPGEEFFFINQFPVAEVNTAGTIPQQHIGYFFTGIDANGTLHLERLNDDSLIERRDEMQLVFPLDDTPVVVPRPSTRLSQDVQIDVRRAGNGGIEVRLINDLPVFVWP